MASLLMANGVSKSFGERVLFEDLNFNIDENSKIGFIGANGVGKTTLFKILTGEEDYEGEFVKNSLLKIGYMEQTPPEENGVTAYDYTLEVFSRLIEIEKELEEIHRKIEEKSGDIESLVKRQDKLNTEYFNNDGMVFRAKTRSMLLGLGFLEEELGHPLSKLSGGQKTRLSLARALLSDANLLLLDEPTNHLDIEAASFLEDFLKNYNRAFIVISHDRYFLDKVTNSTFELENCRITSYTGSYSTFVKKKEEVLEAAKRKYENTMAEIKRIEGIIEQQRRWNRERNIKTAEHKQKSIDRLEKDLEKPVENNDRILFRFPPAKRSGNDVLFAENLSKSYGGKVLFENSSFEIKRGDRVFLLGPNGCGKSTLYGIIKGTVTPDSGVVRRGTNLFEAYYDQNRSDMSGSKTVMDELWDEYPKMVQSE
ncbi:MAG: ABC-F family ATP-binding cassette domain-containing protein, partial [Clostridia bacterium]